MRNLAITCGIGLASGVLSGAFGIGGGIITTPAIRLLLNAPALVAVGTPLPVIFPSALTGAVEYARAGVVDLRGGVICGIAGSATAVLGAWATRLVGGNVVLLATAAIILYSAADTVLQFLKPPRVGPEASEEYDAFKGVNGALEPGDKSDESSANVAEGHPAPRSEPAKSANEGAPDALAPLSRLALIGLITGLYSGFFGLGGGFVLVPMLTRWLGYDIKRAIATSLFTITILAVPGTITHALLGHVDWRIAGGLAVGVIPGAILGTRLTLGAADRTVRVAFAVMLLGVGALLAISALTGGGVS